VSFSDRQKVNSKFVKDVPISLNAIRNVRRTRPAEDESIFRQNPDTGGQPTQPLVNPARARPKLARVMTASRSFVSEKLKAIYGLEAKPPSIFVVVWVQVRQGKAT
jgi:hypothetical protein